MFIAIPIKHDEPQLQEFFVKLGRIAYPKDKIHLFFCGGVPIVNGVSVDKLTNIISFQTGWQAVARNSFVNKHGMKYGSVRHIGSTKLWQATSL